MLYEVITLVQNAKKKIQICLTMNNPYDKLKINCLLLEMFKLLRIITGGLRTGKFEVLLDNIKKAVNEKKPVSMKDQFFIATSSALTSTL